MEHAEVQADAARDMVAAALDGDAAAAFGPPETREDLTGRARMVVARRSGTGAAPRESRIVKDWSA